MRSSSFVVPLLVTLADLAALALAWLVADQLAPPGFPVVLLVPLAFVHQLVLSPGSLHSQLRFVGVTDLCRRVLAAWLRVAVAVCVLGFLLPEQLPKGSAVVFCVVFLCTLAGVRFGSMAGRRWLRQKGRNLRYVVIAGAGEAALRARRKCLEDPGLGLRLVGHLVRPAAAATEAIEVAPTDVVGGYDDLERLVRTRVVDEVVFADPECAFSEMMALLESARVLGLRAHVNADFLGAWRGIDVQEMQGDAVLRLTPYPHDVFGLTVKRAVDLLVGAVALAVLSPLFVVIAAAIKLNSRGPVFFTQTRIGLNGRRFRFPKFRSMQPAAESQLAGLAAQNEMDGPVFKMRKDPRVTRVGRLLRRYSIDELPQLWCVLTGDMSLVGPRPLMPHEVDGHLIWHRRRLSVRPGLTCLWQISGRNDINFDSWMKLDLQYIDTWSLWLDLRILARTVPAVLSGRGAS
jgi:exopolysaccharide biosynthesis polyprenyl glycosylphosphotransferase